MGAARNAGSSDDAPSESARKEQLAYYQKRLLEERKRVLRQLGRNAEQFGASSTEADGDSTNYPLHLGDAGTDTMEQEKSFLLASHETRTLWQVDDALRRLYRSPETFDVCEHCGQRISPERLDAIPYTRLCAKDKGLAGG